MQILGKRAAMPDLGLNSQPSYIVTFYAFERHKATDAALKAGGLVLKDQDRSKHIAITCPNAR